MIQGTLVWRNADRGENLQFLYLLSWQELPVCFLGAPAGVVGWDKAKSLGGGLGEGDLWDPPEMKWGKNVRGVLM